jgi:uncharacterized protein (TIGR00299 family) protein
MRTIYLDCSMGAAGDMLMAALLELLPEKDTFLQKMQSLGLPGLEISAEPSVKCGITGTHMRVLIHGEEESHPEHAVEEHAHSHADAPEAAHAHVHVHPHHHTDLNELTHRISHLNVSEAVRSNILAVYQSIADAESRVHGVPVEQIHFHEVGSLDALADVTGVCLLMELLAPEQVLASPVHVGSGQVRCAHGILPVPAPATALLLEGIPVYGGCIRGELCTPTGAALLRRFVTRFGPLPPMRVEKTGYGMGTKDFEAANCVRAMLGQTEESAGHILELACNLDDMTPEAVGFAMEQLFAAGALDVYTTPIGMKKNRPGVLLTCMCREDDREAMLRTIFRHTSTLGVRVSVCDRYTLSRRQYAVQTPDGEIRVKESSGWGVLRRKAEFEDLAHIARQTGKSIAEVLDTIPETK